MSTYALDVDWRKHAACRDEDPDLFFPVGTSGPALLQVEQAKAVCRRCSVTDECHAWALEAEVSDGIWAGLDENERRAARPAKTTVVQPAAEVPPRAAYGDAPTCHPDRPHHARGLCRTCWQQAYRGDKLGHRPRRKAPEGDILDEFARLHETGLLHKQIAHRLGITPNMLNARLSRARAAGDPRVPAAQNCGRKPKKRAAA